MSVTFRSLVPVLVFALVSVVAPQPALAQDHAGMQMPMPPAEPHQMPAMTENPLGIDQTRDGSGTSWLPQASPMQGAMRHIGSWMLMLHGNAFLEYIAAEGPRGAEEFGSINWVMGMAQRPVRRGQLLFRTMVSVEPLTVGRCGYPTLLASGEQCRGAALHDQQHPHDVFMEVTAQYRRQLGRVAWEVYGGPAGEPALGPTAFPHRLSAMPNPIAPVSHHWLDSTHVSFGVMTGGLYGRRWKVETSAFNGREPDDARYDLDLGALDSYAARVWLMPTPRWALQVSAGHLTEAEAGHDDSREDVNRITASATYHRLIGARLSATTVAWGRNRETGEATSAFMAETALDLTDRDVLYGRGELLQKTAQELVLPLATDESFTVQKYQVGYTRWLARLRGIRTGVGGSVGVSIVPAALAPFYGGRATPEAAVYLTVRPG
ncbi:MAG: hypothetical protein ABI051_04220 [Vicinamibacterales bacterium]